MSLFRGNKAELDPLLAFLDHLRVFRKAFRRCTCYNTSGNKLKTSNVAKKLLPTLLCSLALLAGIVSVVPVQAQQLLTVTAGWCPNTSYAGLYIGIEKGFFKEVGLDIKMVQTTGTTMCGEGMAAGGIDMGFLSGASTLIYFEKGLPFKMTHIYMRSMASNVVMAWPTAPSDGKPIKTIADLKGKKVCAPVGTSAHHTLLVGLKKYGLTEKDLTLLPMSCEDGQAAFVAKSIDAAAVWIPFDETCAKAGGVKIFDNGMFEQAPNPMFALIADVGVMTDKLIKERPDVVRKYLEQYFRAVDWMYANPSEAVDINLKWITTIGGVPASVAGTLDSLFKTRWIMKLEDQYKYFKGFPKPDNPMYQMWMSNIDFNYEAGVTKTKPKPDQYIDASFIINLAEGKPAAFDYVKAAEAAISAAGAVGADTTKAKGMLDQAKKALDKWDMAEATKLATSARQEAERVRLEVQQAQQTMMYGIIAAVVIVAAVAVVAVSRRRKK